VEGERGTTRPHTNDDRRTGAGTAGGRPQGRPGDGRAGAVPVSDLAAVVPPEPEGGRGATYVLLTIGGLALLGIGLLAGKFLGAVCGVGSQA
jgi:hypothetical protein